MIAIQILPVARSAMGRGTASPQAAWWRGPCASYPSVTPCGGDTSPSGCAGQGGSA